MSRAYPFLTALLLVLVSRALLGFLPCDDAQITFRVVSNLLATGQPYFNVQEPLFASSSLLYLLLLAGLGKLGLQVGTAAWGLTLLLDALVAVSFVRLATLLYGRPWLGTLATLCWLTHPISGLNAVSGMETSLFVWGLLCFGEALVRGRLGVGLVLAAALCWIRPDGVVAFPVLLVEWWKGERRLPGPLPALAASLLMVGYAMLTQTWFGAPFPHPMLVKLGGAGGWFSGMISNLLVYAGAWAGALPVWHWIAAPQLFLLVGLGTAARARAWSVLERPLLLIAMVHAAALILSGEREVQYFPWYFVPSLSLLLLPALFHSHRFVLREIQLRSRTRIIWWTVAWGALLIITGMVNTSLAISTIVPDALAASFLPRSVTSVPIRLQRLIDAVAISSGLVLGLWLLFILWLSLTEYEKWRKWVDTTCLGVGLAAAVGVLWVDAAWLERKYERREVFYARTGAWLEKHVEPGTYIGAREIGALGFAAPSLRLFDEVGLVTPEALQLDRATWVRMYRPAAILETSREQLLPPGPAPTGYVRLETLHNRIWLREDVAQTFKQAGDW